MEVGFPDNVRGCVGRVCLACSFLNGPKEGFSDLKKEGFSGGRRPMSTLSGYPAGLHENGGLVEVAQHVRRIGKTAPSASKRRCHEAVRKQRSRPQAEGRVERR